MSKEKFTLLESTCVPLPFENIDTDQIIPARFLSATSREGFGENLFRDWRYDKSGNKNMEFVMNNPLFGGKILIAGKNFGSGSSREHAVWAIYDYGFRAVVSSFFADIFRNNALNNGLLPVVVPEKFLDKLMDLVSNDPSQKVSIDLENQVISIIPGGDSVQFEINPHKKECLLKGLDDIDYLLSRKDQIIAFETAKTAKDED
ncbi:MAG TPA: 3-isopropylmalate dehydratase small subunit [Bacteroidales bacterium]|jgi:3-isopropylmalate/(R)-2-methylmalate dehydratase small subunit|nr:3-isopropylmalate dehydratase small subunit [Bacteroidales bacterium]NLK54463.1 3-isopropylmalate dehydratase small subunit [Bacteroidales bacterium]HNY53637.1 3-isopropylmalate dehydratase small subunit [Bacteroidales bacterium]HOG57390.1 3-isopropylmalate dehydratase small subunit [Bacteroidales bacterium]HPB13410.1 3-isopropylmalate dehydratase small subunit [Bacteroidales bacterium]